MNYALLAVILTVFGLGYTLITHWRKVRKEIVEECRRYVKERINTEIAGDHFHPEYKFNIDNATEKEIFWGVYRLNDWYKRIGVAREIDNSNRLISKIEYWCQGVFFKAGK